MQTIPRPLLILHPDRALANRVRDAAADRFEPVLFEDWSSLREGVAAAPPAAVVVVDPYHPATPTSPGRPRLRRSPSPALQELLEAHPSATVVAGLETVPGRVRDLRTLGAWGVAEIIHAEEDRTPAALRRRLLTARAQPLRRLMAHDEAMHITGRGRALLEEAVETVMVGGLPRDLAETLGMSPSTLLRWCERSQLPNPRRLILWLRVLFASALLDDPGHTVYSVGVACGYSGDQALRRAIGAALPRWTPSELREAGAFETASQAFFKELAELRNPEADRR
jgi:AraC-like DNA-binding protein